MEVLEIAPLYNTESFCDDCHHLFVQVQVWGSAELCKINERTVPTSNSSCCLSIREDRVETNRYKQMEKHKVSLK